MPLSTEEANRMLPQEASKSITDPAHLKYMWVAPPKFGKTTMACMIPDSILLACEEGHAFVETFKIVIDCWDRPLKEKEAGPLMDQDGIMHMSMAEAIDIICASDRFQHVIFDTADMAAKMCSDFMCKKYKVEHAADAGDFGKGFDLVIGAPFRRMIGKLIKSGRGMSFTTHSKLQTKDVNGQKVSKWETGLPSQVQTFLHSQADLIMYGNFGKHRPGMEDRDRIISTDASEQKMAGSRVRIGGKPWPLPKNFILDPYSPWDQFASFFPNMDLTDEALEADLAEARANCDRAYSDYLSKVKGVKAIEREPENVTSHIDGMIPAVEEEADAAPSKGDVFHESPTSTEGDDEGDAQDELAINLATRRPRKKAA